MGKSTGILLLIVAAFCGYKSYQTHQILAKLDSGPVFASQQFDTEILIAKLFTENVYIFGRYGRTNFDSIRHFKDFRFGTITPYLNANRHDELVNNITYMGQALASFPGANTTALTQAIEDFKKTHESYKEKLNALIADMVRPADFDPQEQVEITNFLLEFVQATRDMQNLYLRELGYSDPFVRKIKLLRDEVHNLFAFMAHEQAAIATYYNNQQPAPMRHIIQLNDLYPAQLKRWDSFKKQARKGSAEDGTFQLLLETTVEMDTKSFGRYVNSRARFYGQITDETGWRIGELYFMRQRIADADSWAERFWHYFRGPFLKVQIDLTTEITRHIGEQASQRRNIWILSIVLSITASILAFNWQKLPWAQRNRALA